MNEAIAVAHSKRCPRIIKQEICLLFNVTNFLEVLTCCSLILFYLRQKVLLERGVILYYFFC